MSFLFLYDYTQTNNLPSGIIVKSFGWQTVTVTAFSDFHGYVTSEKAIARIIFSKNIPFSGVVFRKFFQTPFIGWFGSISYALLWLFINFEPRRVLVWKRHVPAGYRSAFTCKWRGVRRFCVRPRVSWSCVSACVSWNCVRPRVAWSCGIKRWKRTSREYMARRDAKAPVSVWRQELCLVSVIQR